MKKFVRRRGVLTTALSPYEVELLGSLVRQVVDLVSDGEPEGFATPDPTADAFEALAADLQVDPDEPEVSDDPVLRRLFPNAYPHDADASSDFRRFTERGLRTTKVVDAHVVLDDLSATEEGSADLRVRPDHVEAWLRTLTSVRLAVATRLGVTDAESADSLAQLDESDPRSYMVSVYDWLGFAQETMVGAL
jgi:hypothetical protein